MSNALKNEKSPYLLQHAENPVDWLPWGEEAFARARRENKPIFLSVGYSTCHWCHVMERESFENENTAQLMNQHFINVKVDREERPDVDRLYMTFVQAATGQGGWPMSVFLTPDLKPFFGGTYFPPRDAYGRPGFPTLLQGLAHAWDTDRERVQTSADSAQQMLQDYAAIQPTAQPTSERELDWKRVCDSAYQAFASEFDRRLGGFGSAPKFPRPVTHDFLHRYAFARYGSHTPQALGMSALTLRAMTTGGMNDQLGGGYHRYSVDEKWIVPHFEKMLYDQAQIVVALLEMFQLSGESSHADAVHLTLRYVLRDLTHPQGGFFAAEDADSYVPGEENTQAHKEEGAFYVWTEAEIDALLSEDPNTRHMFKRFYGVQPNGNAPRSGDPHGEFDGKNILYQAASLDQLRDEFALSPDNVSMHLQAAKETLFAARQHRPRPHRDEKVIVAWNGLMISAFARAAQVLNAPEYLRAAQKAASFLRRELWDAQSQTLRRHFKDGASGVAAFADDYACLAEGLLDLYEADFDVVHLDWAHALMNTLRRDFYDFEHGGFFGSPSGADVSVRFKDDYDGAEPSANSVAARVALRLSELLDASEWREVAQNTLQFFAPRLQMAPHAMPALLGVALRLETPPLHVVIVGDPNAPDTRALLQEFHAHFLPFRSLIVTQPDAVAARFPFTRGINQRDNAATAYVCRDFACRAPVNTPQALREQLEAFNESAHQI